MDQLNSYDYYVDRAECSRKLAARAASPAIAAIHEDLAVLYDGIVSEIEASVVLAARDLQAA